MKDELNCKRSTENSMVMLFSQFKASLKKLEAEEEGLCLVKKQMIDLRRHDEWIQPRNEKYFETIRCGPLEVS